MVQYTKEQFTAIIFEVLLQSLCLNYNPFQIEVKRSMVYEGSYDCQ